MSSRTQSMEPSKKSERGAFPMHERLDILWDTVGLVIVSLMVWRFNLCDRDFNEYLFTAQHAWFILVSLGDSWALFVIVVDVVCALVWCWSEHRADSDDNETNGQKIWFRALSTILNRQAAYVIGLGVWGTFIFSFAGSLGSLVIGVALLVFFVPLIVNLVTYRCIKKLLEGV